MSNIIYKENRIPLLITNTNSETYTRMTCTVFQGSKKTVLKKVKIISKGHADITSYSVKLHDATNNNMIGEITLTNTTEEINDLGTLSNIPENEAILEFYVKITTTGPIEDANLFSILFYTWS